MLGREREGKVVIVPGREMCWIFTSEETLTLMRKGNSSIGKKGLRTIRYCYL